jgi:RimJ/RimL family protein N-acetyltransferase
MFNIYIRPLELSDSNVSWKWRNDIELWKFTASKPNTFVTQEVELLWLQNALKEKNSKRFAIIVDDNYVGNIQLTDIFNLNAQYHIFIGNKDYWGKGIAFHATQQIIIYCKTVLFLKRIYLYVNPLHKKAINLYLKSGFLIVSDEIKMELILS